MPGFKIRIKTFVQWFRGEVRTESNPATALFPVANTPIFIRQYKTHAGFVKIRKTLSDDAKPDNFAKTKKWDD